MSSVTYTTVAIGMDDKWYDLRYEHPSAVHKDESGRHVKSAFAVKVEIADKKTGRYKKK